MKWRDAQVGLLAFQHRKFIINLRFNSNANSWKDVETRETTWEQSFFWVWQRIDLNQKSSVRPLYLAIISSVHPSVHARGSVRSSGEEHFRKGKTVFSVFFVSHTLPRLHGFYNAVGVYNAFVATSHGVMVLMPIQSLVLPHRMCRRSHPAHISNENKIQTSLLRLKTKKLTLIGHLTSIRKLRVSVVKCIKCGSFKLLAVWPLVVSSPLTRA